MTKTRRLRPPAPGEIIKARHKAGLTQAQAAEVVQTTVRAWQYWEAGERRMNPIVWKYFLDKIGQNK